MAVQTGVFDQISTVEFVFVCRSSAGAGAHIRIQVIRMVGESQETVGAGVGGSQSAGSNKLPTLSEYGTNLTQQAAEVGVTGLGANLMQHWGGKCRGRHS
jgi:hypothetical protein